MPTVSNLRPIPTNRARKDWVKEAKCGGLPSLFTGDETVANVNAVKAICNACPVFAECLGYALAYDIPGIDAGTNHSMRKAKKVNRPLLRQNVPIEPEFASYLKEEEPPIVVKKPKTVSFPSRPPRVIEKKPVGQSLWDDLGQSLHELQSSSWLGELA